MLPVAVLLPSWSVPPVSVKAPVPFTAKSLSRITLPPPTVTLAAFVAVKPPAKVNEPDPPEPVPSAKVPPVTTIALSKRDDFVRVASVKVFKVELAVTVIVPVPKALVSAPLEPTNWNEPPESVTFVVVELKSPCTYKSPVPDLTKVPAPVMDPVDVLEVARPFPRV